MKIRQLLFMVLVPAVLLAGCSAESEWKTATSQDTVAAYQNYLSRHPTGPHNTDAGTRIQLLQDEAAWSEAKRMGTVASYQAYLQKAAAQGHRIEAQSAISDYERAAAWESARARGTVASMQEFLKQYPRGLQADHARSKLAELAGFAVQLGSRRSESKAEDARRRLVARYGQVLHNVVIVPPSAEDHSYVLESAPMSEREARSSCATLGIAHQKCAVAALPTEPSAIAAR
jgi:outer membrane protein assembly factor BamD (BamD/ComL family)